VGEKLGFSEGFIWWAINCLYGQREREGFNTNGGGLKGFSTDRRKEVMGELLTNKDSSATVGRVIRVVCPVRHIAMHPEG
jgi:hypothetical protein